MPVLSSRYINLPPPIERAAKMRQKDTVDFWLDKRIQHTANQDVTWYVMTYDEHARLHVYINQVQFRTCA